MATELERQLEELRLGDHICPIHEGIAEQLAIVVPVIRLGLGRNERCLYVAEDPALAAVAEGLRAAGVDVEHERDRGALQFLDPHSRLLTSGRLDIDAALEFLEKAEAAALADGFRGLRSIGAMTWVLATDVEADQLIEYEAHLNRLAAGGRSLILCHYDRPHFDAALIHDVLRSHSVAILGDLVCPNPYYEPPELLLRGERTATREFKRGRAEWWISRLKEVRQSEQERQRILAVSREREELIHLLLDSTAEAVCGVDLDGDCIFANQACARLLGYSDTQEIEGKNMHRLTHHSRADGSPYPEAECPLTAALLRGEAMHLDEESFWRSDGSQFMAECWSHPMRRDGELIGSVVTLLDISERKALEEQLRHAQRMEALGQLTGGIAHDFNNLLTVVLGNADLLAEDSSLDDEQRHQAGIIRSAAQRGADLVSRMLAFARRQPLRPANVDVNTLIRSMDDLLERSLGAQVEIRYSLQEGLSRSTVDPAQLESAILNLAINAWDAMPGGGGLLIETRNVRLDSPVRAIDPDAQPGDYVRVVVQDSGHGMTPEVLRQATQPFFTTKAVGEGSGLGLSMVYGFAKQSSGHMDIVSDPGAGTRVTLYLPCAQQEAAQAAGARGGDTAPLARGGELVLLVEDDDLVRGFVETQLRMLGYRVVSAANGLGALAILRAEPDIDLLLTDIMMPGGMNGLVLAEQAGRLRPRLKVLFTSGYAESVLLRQGRLPAGAQILKKPYRLRELANEVRQTLDRRE